MTSIQALRIAIEATTHVRLPHYLLLDTTETESQIVPVRNQTLTGSYHDAHSGKTVGKSSRMSAKTNHLKRSREGMA
jgi:hypothetical protein